MSDFAYEPLFWMGQTFGFVVMAAALGIWRQVAVMAGTSFGTRAGWLGMIAMLSMQAGSRFLLGLSSQLDGMLAIRVGDGVSHGPFMLAGMAISVVGIATLWPMVAVVARHTGLRGVAVTACAATGCSLAFVACSWLAVSPESFVNLAAAFTLGGSGLGMLMLSRGQMVPKIGSVRVVVSMVVVVGLGFGWSALHPGLAASVAATLMAFLGSGVLFIGLHWRIKIITNGGLESSLAIGTVYGALAWIMLLLIGPVLWEAAGRPPGVYRDYVMILGLLGALFTVSWHFRCLSLAAAAYVERLGRDQSKALLQGIDVAAFLLDHRQRIVECSKGAESLAGAKDGKLDGMVVWDALGVHQGAMGKFDRIDARGRQLLLTWAALGEEEKSQGLRTVLTVRDATSERATKLALDKAAREDELTGLPNRREALAIVDEAIEGTRGIGELGLLFLDLDHFKNVNDTEGHAAGDALLREVSIILESCLSEAGGWLARLGGDEFLGVLPGADEHRCHGVAMRCVESMERSARAVKGSVGVSVGVSLFPRDGDTGIDLIRRADAAMYESKSGGRGRVSFFGAAIEERLRRRVQVEGFLREALKVDEGLALALQPICGLDGSYLGDAEALIRAPGMTGLGAQELVEVAEQSGLIMQLGRWVLRQAVAIQADHARQGAPVVLSINVSAKQFMDDLFWEQFRGMARLGQFRGGITLEVTETTLMEDRKRAARLLQEARSLGARIALDDFGAGYSSLSTLKSMPLDKLKLDKSLFDLVPEDKEAARLAQAAIAMARALGLEVVAEGIERPEQAKWLMENGVKMAQGYLFAKPMASNQLLALSLSGEKKFYGQPKTPPVF